MPRRDLHLSDPGELARRLADNARAERKRRTWSQEEAAHRCELTTRQYARVEAGVTDFRLSTVQRVCGGLELAIGDILGRGRRRPGRRRK